MKKRLPGKRKISRALLAVMIFAAACVPWMIRNYVSGGGFRLVTNGAKAVRYNFAAAVEAEVENIPAGKIRSEWKEADNVLFESDPERFPDEDARYRYRMAEGMEVIRQYPFTFAMLCARPYAFLPAVDGFYEHIGVSAGGKGTLDVLQRDGPFAAVDHYFDGKPWLLIPVIPWLLILAATYLGCLRGIWICIRERDWASILTFFFFAAYYLAIIGPITLSRYRLPAMPAIALMAGLGLTFRKISEEKK
jgi:4-amino-4-deoxy-L-arabinose transferase-like glycosyltransferase